MKILTLSVLLFFYFTSNAQFKVKFNKKTNDLTFYDGSKIIATGIEKYSNVEGEPWFSLEPPPEEVISQRKFAFDLLEKSKKLSFIHQNIGNNYVTNPLCSLKETSGITFSDDTDGILKKDTIIKNGMFFIMDSYFDRVRQRNFYKIGFVSVKERFVIQPKYINVTLHQLDDIYISTIEFDSIRKTNIHNLYQLKDKKLIISNAHGISVTKFGKSYIFRVEKDDKYTILDKNFKTVIPSSSYLSLVGNDLSEGCYKPNFFVASLSPTDKTDNMGIYSNSGDLLMRDITFKNHFSNHVTNKDFFSIQKDGKYGLIDSKCKLLVPFKSEIELGIPYINYPEMPILIKENGKYGYINSLFLDKSITSIIYDDAKSFYDINGLPEADVSLNGKWGILNAFGKYLIHPNSLEPVSSLDFKKYIVKKNDGYYLLESNLSDEKILFGPFDSYKMISENYLFITVGNKKRVINFANFKISYESFDDVKATIDNIIVINNGQEMIFDSEKMRVK